MKELHALLIKHEGKRNKPYVDSVGKITIGVGRNLEDVGLSDVEIDVLLANDIISAKTDATVNFDWYQDLDHVRRDVITMMIFNLGINRFKKFEKMIAAVADARYELAAIEMMDSLWARQVGNRAVELANMMSSGKYPDNV